MGEIDDPWLARDLAAHLVIRDSRPDLSTGQYVPALRGRLDEATHDLAATDFVELVERVRQGPPTWSPTRIARVDEVINGGEFFIHHEDLLRGAPGAGWTSGTGGGRRDRGGSARPVAAPELPNRCAAFGNPDCWYLVLGRLNYRRRCGNRRSGTSP